ncbi:MAG TPA: hypothetical protein VFJ82_27020 [Longimicrobium sp.]|nr:hypothetical protein [Longimicrobium sp.]
MRTAAAVLASLGIALAAFGWWGVFTGAGMRRYEEMDGLIPFFAGCAGLFLLAAAIVALAAWWRSARRSRAAR